MAHKSEFQLNNISLASEKYFMRISKIIGLFFFSVDLSIGTIKESGAVAHR